MSREQATSAFSGRKGRRRPPGDVCLFSRRGRPPATSAFLVLAGDVCLFRAVRKGRRRGRGGILKPAASNQDIRKADVAGPRAQKRQTSGGTGDVCLFAPARGQAATSAFLRPEGPTSVFLTCPATSVFFAGGGVGCEVPCFYLVKNDVCHFFALFRRNDRRRRAKIDVCQFHFWPPTSVI